MLWIELIIFLAIIVIGARIGGIGMGTVAGLGLIVFTEYLSLLLTLIRQEQHILVNIW